MTHSSLTIIRQFVKGILHRPLAYDGWSVQGLGMLRLYLDPDKQCRLHVWDPDLVVPDVTRIHTHPWDFESTVIAGEVVNEAFYAVVGWDNPVVAGHRYLEQALKCGEDAHLTSVPQKVRLSPRPLEVIHAGRTYSQERSIPHASWPAPGTVTLVSRTFYPDRDHAFVYYREGETWVDAAPRRATPDEIRNAVDKALKLF